MSDTASNDTTAAARGWANGLIGVVIFSGSLPATRVAVAAFDPIFLTAARAVIAGLLGLALLRILRAPRPAAADVAPLAVVALGVVVGFPLLTAVALRHVTAGHSTVFIGMLPLSTAIFAVLRGGERPRPAFWAFSLAGAAIVAGFALREGALALSAGDLAMLGAVILCGLGYAEGARLSRRLGGWQVISWALAMSLPVMACVAVAVWPAFATPIAPQAWLALGYVSLFSMLVGFIFWYRGLALGGIAAVGQLQLAQPFFSLLWAGWLLGETISPIMIAASLAVVACVAGAKRFAR